MHHDLERDVSVNQPPRVYDPFSEEMHRDPYPTYKWLRDHAPVYYNAERGLWAVSRHDDVIEVTRDWERFSNAEGADTDNLSLGIPAPGNFLDTDPPVHDELRAVVHKPFMPKVLQTRLEPFVRRTVNELLEGFGEHDEVDFAEDFAWAVSVRTTGELLGTPSEDASLLKRWGVDVTRRVGGVPEPPPAARAALVEIDGYLREQLGARRRTPTGDLLSAIANASVSGEPIGDAAVGLATLVMIAGMETTASLITSALHLLWQHPDQRRWLADHPSAIPAAVEEVLRFESPVQHLSRVTTADVALHDIVIPRGSRVVVLYGSANRDERRYERADRFDIRRESMRNLAFGNGIHHCLGAPLARLEARVVLERVLSELPDYEVTGPIERFCSHMDRGLARLPGRRAQSTIAVVPDGANGSG
jgi:cytochrome P450